MSYRTYNEFENNYVNKYNKLKRNKVGEIEEIEEIEKENKETLDNCLRLANESLEKSKLSLAELDNQWEMINEINDKLDVIHERNTRAKKIINKISSVFGVINPANITGKIYKNYERAKIIITDKINNKSVNGYDYNIKNNKNGDNGDNEDNENDKLNQLYDVACSMTKINLAISDTLDNHNMELTQIDYKVNQETNLLKTNNKKIEKLLK